MRSAAATGGREPLKNVEFSIGRRTVPLKIVTSEIKQTELASLARGRAVERGGNPVASAAVR